MNITYDDIGLASLQTDEFTQIELFAGDTPAVVTDHGVLGAALAVTGIPAWTPVHVDAATRAITLAVTGSANSEDDVQANAVTVAPVVPGSPATASVPVYKAGMFNVEALRFGESFDTDAKKFSAFNLAECQIYVKAPFYG